MSATPGRGEVKDENQKLVRIFNGNKITLQDDNFNNIDDPITYLQDRGFLAKVDRKPVPTNIEIDLSDEEKEHLEKFYDLPASVITKLGEDIERNALIVVEIAKLFELGRTVIVFACSVKHARVLTCLLYTSPSPRDRQKSRMPSSA